MAAFLLTRQKQLSTVSFEIRRRLFEGSLSEILFLPRTAYAESCRVNLLERELRVTGTTRPSQRSPQIFSAKEKGAILLA
jgi:hypothetical protein